MATAADADDTAVDTELFRVMGLYRLLCRAEDGGVGPRTRRAFVSLVCLTVGYFTTQIALLRSTDIQRAMYTFVMMAYGTACVSKTYALMRHGVRLGAAMEAARFSFTASAVRRPATMRRYRDVLSWLLRRLNAFYVVTSVLWVMAPVALPAYETVARADGTAARYRCTLYCLWFPLPERVHNSAPVWTAFWLAEAVAYSVSATGMILFDTYLLTTCCAMNGQFRTVSAGCETIGRRPRRPRSDDRPPGTCLCHTPTYCPSDSKS